MAHKKAAGSAKNLRDSQPKYRGVKIFGGQKALPWNIIIRQKGSKYECGKNTYLAADFTIHASSEGIVHFRKKNFKRFDGRTYLKTVVEVLTVETVSVEKVKKVEKKAEPKKEVIEKPTEVVEEKVEVAEKPVKKAPAKKPVEKKEPAVKKSAPKKEAVEKPAKKAPAKKPTAKKAE